MEDAELILLAIDMRKAQKRYFANRLPSNLVAAKTAENAFDKGVQEWVNRRVEKAVEEADETDEAQEWHDFDPDC